MSPRTRSPSSFDHDDAKFAQDVRRKQNHRHKYALGTVERGNNRVCPRKPHSDYPNRGSRAEMANYFARYHSFRKGVGKHANVTEDGIDDYHCSIVDNVVEFDPYSNEDYPPFPDEDHLALGPVKGDIKYSYDSPGPASGERVLGEVVNKAVERFEDACTEKLIREEYDVIKEEEPAAKAVVDEDEDFEFV